MKFGVLERKSIKVQAKQLLRSNFRFCFTASLVLFAISLFVRMLEGIFTSSMPDYLGMHNITDPASFYARLVAEPLTFGRGLWDFYLHLYLYKLLAKLFGLMLEAPFLLAFMGCLYRIGVYGEHPPFRDLESWYMRLGLSLRAMALVFFLDIFFEFLLLVLFFGPLVLMVYMSIHYLAIGAAVLPLWVPALPLLSVAGLIFGALLYARWLPALHFMAKYPRLSPRLALKKSSQELKGHRREYVVLLLSFLPWFLLEEISYGVASIYVLPYLELTVTLFLEKIRHPSDPPPKAP